MTSSSSTALPTFFTPPTVNIHELTKDNFTTWKAQVIPYFIGLDLFGYLDGTIPKPHITLSSIDATNATSSSPIPAYTHWICQDALILSAIMSTLTEPIVAKIKPHMMCLASTGKDLCLTMQSSCFSSSFSTLHSS
jgi:hypothetical protein